MAAEFAALQTDVIAAMAEAGRRGLARVCGGVPPIGGDQLFQLRALITLEQFDRARDPSCLGRASAMFTRALHSYSRPVFAASSGFKQESSVHLRRNGRTRSASEFALIAHNGLSVPRQSSFRQIWLARFLVLSAQATSSGLCFSPPVSYVGETYHAFKIHHRRGPCWQRVFSRPFQICTAPIAIATIRPDAARCRSEGAEAPAAPTSPTSACE